MMKKIIIILAFFLQTNLMSQNLKFGVNASINNETRTSIPHNYSLSGKDTFFNSETSYNYGITVLYKLISNIYINTSVLYSVKKVSTVFSGPADGPIYVDLRFDYISIAPKIEINPIFGLYVNAGPSIDFKVNTELNQSRYSAKVNETNSVRFGILMSVGYRIDFHNNNAFAAEFSYDKGLSSTHPDYGGIYSTSRAGLIFYFL